MIGNLKIIAKMFDFEERVLISWLANTVREPANQDAYPAIDFMLRAVVKKLSCITRCSARVERRKFLLLCYGCLSFPTRV